MQVCRRQSLRWATLAALSLASVATRGHADAESPADGAEPSRASISQLFDEGGQPTGGVVPGNSFAFELLLELPRRRVVEEALQRLQADSLRRYDHAFAIYCLCQLAPGELREILPEVYPRLDEAGQYEALLYAFRAWDERFVPAFAKVLNRPDATQLTRLDLLAAAYATRFPRREFLPGLDRLLTQANTFEKQLESQPALARETILDGFPYDNFIFFRAAPPRIWVRRAQQAVKWTVERPPRTAAERALLNRNHERMFDPTRGPVQLQRDSLEGVRALQVHDTLIDLQLDGAALDPGLSLSIDIQQERAAASDVVAAICNQTRVTPLPGLRLMSFRADDSAQFTAAAGFVVELTQSYQAHELLGPWIHFQVRAIPPVDWPGQSLPGHFRVDEIRAAGRSVHAEQDPRAFNTGSFSLFPARNQLDEGTLAEIRGHVGVFAPAVIRQVEVDLGPEPIPRIIVEDRFALSVEKTRLDDDDHWDVTVRAEVIYERAIEAGWYDSASTTNLGAIQALNSQGQVVGEQVLEGAGMFGTQPLIRGQALPAKLVWTFAPHCELKLLPVVFRDVPLATADTVAAAAEE